MAQTAVELRLTPSGVSRSLKTLETELGCRLILRGQGFSSADEPQACEVPAVAIDRGVRGQVPAALRGIRIHG